jgi:hypothetical protein
MSLPPVPYLVLCVLENHTSVFMCCSNPRWDCVGDWLWPTFSLQALPGITFVSGTFHLFICHYSILGEDLVPIPMLLEQSFGSLRPYCI